MRANEFIVEAFNQPYPIQWEKSEYGNYDALATLDDGTYLSIMFTNNGDDEWDVEFHRNASTEVTGAGDAQRVFATVLTAIQQFIQQQHPWRIIFSASKDVRPGQNSQSRAKLYNSLIARYARAWGYDEYNEDHGDQVTYELTRLEQGVNESLRIDVPNDSWLQSKIDYAQERGRNRFGAPYMGSTTAWATEPVMLPVSLLKTFPGLRGEQQNVRQDDLEAIMKIMQDTGRLPLTSSGEEYAPFVQVAYNGEPWVNEGNHRIMAAAALGFKEIPVELKYYDGGERIKSGPLYPGRIGLA